MTRTLFVAMTLLSLGCSATVTPSPLPTTASAARRRVLPDEATDPSAASFTPPPPAPAPPPTRGPDPSADPLATIDAAMVGATPGARRVLEATRAMIADEVIVRGSCYTWLNAVYARAGGRSHAVYTGPRRAPFTAFELLTPGDWVFFINHSYNDVTHSAIFLAWVDPAQHVALMASYPGNNRRQPGRFSTYELTNVYQIVRKVEGAPAR